MKARPDCIVCLFRQALSAARIVFDIDRDVRELVGRPFAISALSDLRADLGPGRRLLYLGDNAGEIVFDVLLVDELLKTGTEVVFSVKSAPIINDATLKEAREAGLTERVRVIETGSNDIGVNWERASKTFREHDRRADIVLGKGHGNFETCSDLPANRHFLLKAKCPMVAEELECALGDIVFTHQSRE